MSKMKGNCMMGCKHCAYKDIYKKREFKDSEGTVYGVMNEFVGREHYCDENNELYQAWRERNANNTYDVYKNDIMECFEPTELVKGMNEITELEKKILDKLNGKENE